MSEGKRTPELAPDATEIGSGDPEQSAEGAMLMRRLQARLFDEQLQPVRVGRFTLLRTIGSGGMGVVHLGYDETLDRRVAVKLIRKDRSRTRDAHERLLREARAMARLSHPHVVQIYEAGEYDEGVFIAMEFVEGQTLGAWRIEAKPGWQRCVEMYVAAGRGLAAAHAADVIHRDFKPDNVLLTVDGTPKVGDFGLAGIPDQRTEPGESQPSGSLERTRATLGTPRYMPPEQFKAEPADARSDQYSFCVALYEAIYGEPPFVGKTIEALAREVIAGRRQPIPSTPVIPHHIAAALDRGMSPEPAERFASMAELLAELQPRTRRRRSLIAAAVGSVSLAAVVGWFSQSDEACTGASEHLEAIWNDERRGQIAAAIERDARPYLVRAWTRAGPTLDRFAADWIDQHTAACRATRVTEEQSVAMLDRRMACLHRARASLRATTDVLLAADADQLGRIDALVGRLPKLERCADVEALASDVPLPSPEDKEAVEAVEVLIAKVVAMQAAGQVAESESIVHEAEAAVEGLSYEPVRARVLLVKGATEGALRKADGGIETLEQAQVSALSQGYWNGALDATVRIAFQLAVVQHRFAEAEPLWAVGDGLLRYTNRIEDRARYLGHRGAARSEEARYDEAIADLEAAIDGWIELGPGETSRRVNVRSNLAETLIQSGDAEGAENQLRVGIEELVARYGPGHPTEARLHYNLGRVLVMRGDGAAAAVEYDKAITQGEESMPGHPFLASFALGRASAAYIQGHFGEAVERLTAVIDAWQERLGVDHPTIAIARSQWTASLIKLGELDRAEEQARTALTLSERRFGRDHGRTAIMHHNLGAVLLEQGRVDEAAATYDKALEIKLATLSADSSGIATTRVDYAEVLVRQGQLEDAERELELALEVYEADPSAPLELARAKRSLGLLRQARGDLDGALEAMERARDLLASMQGEQHHDVAAITQTIGELRLEAGDYDRAVKELTRAVEQLGEVESSPALRGKALFGLAKAQSHVQRPEHARTTARKALDELGASKAEHAKAEAEEVRRWLADPGGA